VRDRTARHRLPADPGGQSTAAATAAPRIAPVPAEAIPAEVSEILARLPPGAPAAFFRTLAHHPALLRAWTEFGNHVVGRSTLPARDRELLILRVSWHCGSTYVFAAHLARARAAGIGDTELERVQDAPGATPPRAASPASAGDALLLRAADELWAESSLRDETWSLLRARYSLPQLLDLVFTVGQYQLVSAVTNALRIAPEADRG
jgi:4-carboxymuconolactone decarboxylase